MNTENPNNIKVKSEKILGLNRNVFFVGLTSFLTDTSTKLIYSVMPLFLLSIGASKTTLSLIEGIAESTAALLKAFSGFWSDKIGKNKPFMILGYGLTAIISPLYSTVGRPIQVLYLRFIERVGKGLRTAPRDSLIAGSIDKSETGKSFGFHKAMDNSGAIIGPLIAFLVLWFFPGNYKLIFMLSGIPAILGVFTIYFLVKESKKPDNAGKEKFAFKNLPKRYYFFLTIIFLFSLGNSTDALLLVRTKETHVDDKFIPFIYMIFNSVSVVLAIPFGKLSDRIGREVLLILGFLVYAIVYFGFGMFLNLGIFIFLFMLYGLYSALTDSCQKALISDFLPPELKGTGFGIYHALLGLTLLPASLIAGRLYDKVSPSASFYFGSAMALIAALAMTVFLFTDFINKKRKANL
jgi:MFS family permease